MDWQKVVFNEDQIADGEYERIHDRISEVIFADSRYRDVAVGTTSPLDDATMTAYFSPDAVRYFGNLITPYLPAPCDAPTGIKLSWLAVDPDRFRS